MKIKYLSLGVLFSALLITSCGNEEKKPEKSMEVEIVEKSSDAMDAMDAMDAKEDKEDKKEVVRGVNEQDDYIIKSGRYLRVPDELPSDIPIIEDANIVSTTVGHKGSASGEGVQILYLFDDPNGLTKAIDLYTTYFDNAGFDKIEKSEPPKSKDGGTMNIKGSKENESFTFYVQKYADDDQTTVTLTLQYN